MSSFMNPSKGLTDLLSKYLEFDPEQLQLGIWSGDLSLKEVCLKRESINPILRDLTSTPTKVDERPPLLLTLLKYEIGHFRVQIPWKRLVWGAGDVRVTLSDVVLVVGFESQTNCNDIIDSAARPNNNKQGTGNGVEEDGEEAREVKQEQLREAERLMLQGLPVSPAMKQKPSHVQEEALDLQEAAEEAVAGRLDKWLKSITSSFLWRFFAGLQASIRNVRIVMMQDGVEIGVICHSMEAGTHVEDMTERRASLLGVASNASSSSDAQESKVENETELDAGDRQVDKQLKIRGLGLFVREETNKLRRVPREFKFSTSVTADDYLLRPSEVDIFVSIFYPSSNSKLIRKTSLSVEDHHTVETEETTASSKARRGKRDRGSASVASVQDSGTAKESDTSDSKAEVAPLPTTKGVGRPTRRATLISTGTDSAIDLKSNLWADAVSHADTRSSTHRSSIVSNSNDAMIATPHFDVNIFFGDIRTLCTKRHHGLVHVFSSAQAKMRNGRPARSILSELVPGGAQVKRSVMVETPLAPPSINDGQTTPSSAVQPPALQRSKTDSYTLQTPASNKLVRLHLLQPETHSERSAVVKEWWKYAFSCVLWQLRRRRHLRAVFKPSLTAFDWKKQRYLRKEYVDLYIMIRLERRAFHARLAHLSEIQAGEEQLSEMEDELQVEQILLYRSIARALGVRGLDSMPDSILEMHGGGNLGDFLRDASSDSNSEEGGHAPRYSSTHEADLDQENEIQNGEFLSPLRLKAKNARSRRLLAEDNDKDSTAESAVEDEEAEPHNHDFLPLATNDRFFPDMDSNAMSLGSSQRNAAADVPSLEPMERPIPISKKGIRAVSFSKDHRGDHDAKTVKTFKTAKSAHSKVTRGSETGSTAESKRIIRFSFSLKFQSVELMLCDSNHDLRASPEPSQASKRYGSIGFFDGEDQSDDVSELSVGSSDFTDPEGLGELNSEDLSLDINIMSSNDFLLFGAPNSILHVVVTDVIFLLNGSSVGSHNASLSVSQLEILGSESLTLVRSESLQTDDVEQNRSVEAVSDGQGANSESAVVRQEKALVAYLLDVDEKDKHIQCDLSKITATLERTSLSKLGDFFATDVRYPGSVIPMSAYETARSYLAKHIEKQVRRPSARVSANAALRIHGFELIIPLVRDALAEDKESLDSGTENAFGSAAATPVHAASVSLSVGLFELYFGDYVDDLTKLQGGETRSYSTPASHGNEDDGARRKLGMLDVEKNLESRRPFAQQHAVIAFSGIDCTVASKPEAQMSLVGTSSLLEMPLDAELLFSRASNFEIDGNSPDHQVVVHVSPLLCLISKARLEVISACVQALVGVSGGASAKRPVQLTPRVAVLSGHVLQSVYARFGRIRVSLVTDKWDTDFVSLSLKKKEIILEEAISDYLSFLSCFDLEYPAEEPLEFATNICTDRLSVLGLTTDEAEQCAARAVANFLADIEIMKRSHAQVLMELSSSEEAMGSHTNASKMEHLPASAGYEDDEVFDDDSEETLDIVETTISNAVEKTVQYFLSLIEERHVNGQQYREIFVVDLEQGGTISMVNLFYDFHVACNVSVLAVRDGAGIHVVTIGKRKPLTLKQSQPGADDVSREEAVSATEKLSDVETFLSENSGMIFSRFQIDKGQEFGCGGMSIRALAHEENANDTERSQELLDDIIIGDCEVFFSQSVTSGVLESMRNIAQALSRQTEKASTTDSTTDPHYDGPQIAPSVVCKSTSFTLLMASDELVPFTTFILEDVSIRNDHSQIDVSLSARSFSMLNLTPEGQTYPSIITPLADHKGVSLLLEIKQRSNTWTQSTVLDLTLSSCRVLVVRQHINELIQFFSAEFGLGLLLSKLRKGNPLVDDNGNPPPPLLYRVVVEDSSLVIPRSSMGSELLAVQVDGITVFNTYHEGTWSLPTETTPFSGEKQMWPNDQLGPPTSAETSTDVPDVATDSFNSSVSDIPLDTEFQDCVDCVDRIRDSSAPKGGISKGLLGGDICSSFDKKWISRISVLCEGMRMFSALSNRLAEADFDNVRFHRFHRIAHRVDKDECVYEVRDDIHFDLSDARMNRRAAAEKMKRKWEEISITPLSIHVLVDYAPHLRLLIADCIDIASNDAVPLGLDARMSQMYMLFSLWYSNMQELPVLFPYSDKRIEESARQKKPSVDFPEYGTDLYVRCLKDLTAVSFELACFFREFSLSCSFDAPGYFSHDPKTFSMMPRTKGDDIPIGSKSLSLRTRDLVVHVATDSVGLLRMGSGANGFEILDNRKGNVFSELFAVKREEDKHDVPPFAQGAWADLSWGLDCGGNTFDRGLKQPFQFSVFMTPNWSLINLGVDGANAVMFDLSPIWILLDVFSSYFSDAAFGHPAFEAAQRVDILKRAKRKPRESNDSGSDDNAEKSCEPTGMNTDFRLWLLHPHLTIPGSHVSTHSPCVRVECRSGLWFHYKSLGSFASQEIATTNLSLGVAEEFQSPALCRGQLGIDVSGHGARTLVDGLSLALRYDFDSLTNFTSFNVQIPFMAGPNHYASSSCSVTSSEIEVKPWCLPPPTICSPVIHPARSLGSPVACEFMVVWELLPIASKLLINLAKGGASGTNENDSTADESKPEASQAQGESSFSFCSQIGSLRLYIVDPVLGMHLPVAVLSVSSIACTASQLGSSHYNIESNVREAPTEDLQVAIDCHFWADYFKLGITRSWEPLLEPYQCILLYEKSRSRGQGLSLNSDSPLHVNVTGALLVTLDETINTLKRSISQAFGESSQEEKDLMSVYPFLKKSNWNERTGMAIEETRLSRGRRSDFVHEVPKPMKSGERVAFSFLNLTGQKIRIHQETLLKASSSRTTLTYLEHLESTRLDFKATMSMLRNLDVSEVPFPGLQNSSRNKRSDESMMHTIDVQIPGFAWIQALSVDTSGRRFDDLVPRSAKVRLKIRQDWRLENALKLLTEVGLENGGRLITVRTPFEVRNNTSHAIFLTCHPDPRHQPVAHVESASTGATPSDNVDHGMKGSISDVNRETESYRERIQSGETHHIPTLLLEAALQNSGSGSHLGCLWIRPERDEHLFDAFEEDNATPERADYCSRPIQFAKVVHESAMFFASGNGEDLPSEKISSGIQVSCPLSEREEGVSFAPFCYVVEIRRSPLISKDRGPALIGKDRTDDGKSPQREAVSPNPFVHGPVSYSLIIHPPLVIENLLPEGGRFELMHASRRTVLWFADLQPGERVPVHSVGLDAPLLLLINLGYCRTPVGEGALVHHGSVTNRGFGLGSHQRVRLKTIGKAVTKGTKQVGKTITDIIDSPDKRGQGKLFMIQNPQYQPKAKRSQLKKRRRMVDSGTLGLDTGFSSGDTKRGKVHRVEDQYFSPEDVATETTVVDSVGQRLTLRIDNVRGGGGQRRIALFCPFWIVNTTEHSLRYKQEKSSFYTSGTVVSASQDGSKPVDGSNRNYVSQHEMTQSFRSISPQSGLPPNMNRGTMFAGTPGALATAPGKGGLSPSVLAKLLDKDLPIDRLSSMAFMFNFHEDVISIGHQKLCVQLGGVDSRYTSKWSPGFSLDSVGVTEVVGMQCKEGRALELSVTISVAPSVLSGYTKIVRFSPRYVLMNHLEQPIRLWQDSSLLHTTVGDTVVNVDAKDTKSRKWYITHSADRFDKNNHYESLFGRPVALAANLSDSDDFAVGTTAHPSALYLGTAGPSDLVPFHLADTRSERQLRIDLGYPWNLTASFSSDVTGDYTLKPTKAMDLRLLRHVSTRASPQYRVVLPPPLGNQEGTDMWDGELGVWFETDWGGEKRIIVKGAKRGKYAFNHTDIHVGDELLLVDGEPVASMPFADVMKLLKERIAHAAARQMSMRDSAEISRRMRRRSTRILRDISLSETADIESLQRVVLTFRTVEERLRRLRVKASETNRWNSSDSNSSDINSDLPGNHFRHSGTRPSNDPDDSPPLPDVLRDLHVDLRTLHNSMFIFVRTQNIENPPFRIENRAINHVIHFRQRGCDWHPWTSLKPGESRSYAWEEPMRQKKLVVKVGRNDVALSANGQGRDAKHSSVQVSDDIENATGRVVRNRQPLSFPYVDSEEFGGFGATKVVKLEEIGFVDFLPCPGEKGRQGHIVLSDDYLHCQVDTDGATRVLVISDRSPSEEAGLDEHTVVERHLATLGEQQRREENKLEELQRLKLMLPILRGNSTRADLELEPDNNMATELDSKFFDAHAIEGQAKQIAELSDSNAATQCHQVVVEVMEATGLSPSDFSGLCNPYCEIVFKERTKKRSFLSKGVSCQRTYYIEKTTSPKWVEQTFVFDVPIDAVKVTRGHSIRVRLRNFRSVGYHSDLGQTNVYLRSLRNQQELIGWYPLVGRNGRSELDDSTNLGRGSVKVRVQWIYTVSGLLDYFILLSERRLTELRNSRAGMERQLENAIEADKRKRSLQDPFSVVRIPNMIGSKLKSAIEEDDDVARRATWKKLRQSLKISKDVNLVDDVSARDKLAHTPERQLLKVANAKYMWWMHAQTKESKRNRRLSYGKQEHPMETSLEKVDEAPSEESDDRMASTSGSEKSLEVADIDAFNERRSSPPLQGQSDSLDLDIEAAVSSIRSLSFSRLNAISPWDSFLGADAETTTGDGTRVRSASLNDMRSSQESNELRPFMFRRRRGQSGASNVLLELPTDILVGVGSDGQEVTTEEEEEAQRILDVDTLVKQGMLFHTGSSSFHRRHLAYHFRETLLPPDKSSSDFRPRSNLRATFWLGDLKSWITAQAIVNDEDLSSLLSLSTDSNSNSSTETVPAAVNWIDTSTADRDTSPANSELLNRLSIPNFAPASMVSRARSRAEDIIESRNSFEKACKISLKSILNPGGWLTIRPITALNLSEDFTGMSVKVRYGTEVLTSRSADAKVTPTWAFDEDIPLTPRPEDRMHRKLRRRLIPEEYDFGSASLDEFKFDDNDLPIHIEPLQTSGTIRISVVGERINSKAEIGVLHLPLGAAISCCIESLYDYEERKDEIPAPSSPFYVRWFPLMNPKDTAPVEGDLGLSSRPTESEKVRDSMFSQYFTPCIKLALIWQPDSEISDLGDRAGSPPGVPVEGKSPAGTPSLITQTYFNADIGRISTALIDSQRAIELLSVSLSDVDVRYSVTKAKTRTTLAVGWVQVDHQDDNAREPVVLAPTPVAHPQPTVQFITVKDNPRSKSNVDSYQYIGLALQEMDLTVEESWMFDLWEFFISVVRRRDVRRKNTTSDNVTRKPFSPSSTQFHSTAITDATDGKSDATSLAETLSQHLQADYSDSNPAEKKVYVEQLLLGVVKFNLTYMKGGKKGVYEVTDRGGWVVRDDFKDMFSGLPQHEINLTLGGMAFGQSKQASLGRSEIFALWCENTHDEEIWTENEDSAAASRNLPHIIASVFPSVSDARVRLQGKLIEHVFESPGEIFASIQNYYVNETLRQIYKIMGSVDFVGNPSMLLSSLVTGVRDFVVAPSKEFFRNPKNPSRVGIGCAKGTLSLFSHSASGLFGFASKVSATAGQAAAVLSCDDAYRQWHNDMVVSQAKNLNRRWKKKGSNSAKRMVTKPIEDVVLGIISGTSGIFVSPYKGAVDGGAVGFAQGLGVGAIGIVIKPLVGVLDALAHFTGSIHDVAKSVNVMEKRYRPARKLRLPYVFGLKNVLMPFDLVTARSIHLLKRYPVKAKKGKFLEREVHIASEVLQMEPGVVTHVIATTYRVILIRVKRDHHGNLLPSLRWQVRLNTEAVISSSVEDEGHNGVALTIIRRERNTVSTPLKGKKEDADESPSVIATPLRLDQSNALLFESGDEGSHLGTRPSRVWESISDPEQQGTNPQEMHLHGSAQSQKGEVLAWFRVLGEFHHRKSLTRMHNAISCICGNLESVIWAKGLNKDGSKSGYTTFGEMVFEARDTSEKRRGGLRKERELSDALETVPWMSSALFKRSMDVPLNSRQSTLLATRSSWLFSDELEISSQEGGPTWLVEARARATFVALDPPPLPSNLSPIDEVVLDIFRQLKRGNISYKQACELIKEHAETVDADRALTKEASGEDDVFHSANLFDSNAKHSTAIRGEGSGSISVFDSARTSLPIALQDNADDESLGFMSPMSAKSRSTLQRLDSVSEEEESERDEASTCSVGHDDIPASNSHQLPSRSHSPLRRDEAPLDDEDDAVEAKQDRLLVSQLESRLTPPEQREEQPRPSDSYDEFFISAKSEVSESRAIVPFERNDEPPTEVNEEEDEEESADPDVDARLARMEAMMEQLIRLNTVKSGLSQSGDNDGIASLRAELNDLQQQMVQQRNYYQEALATASLRQEVADLRREAAGQGRRGLKYADVDVLREEVSEIKAQFDVGSKETEEEKGVINAAKEAEDTGGLRREAARQGRRGLKDAAVDVLREEVSEIEAQFDVGSKETEGEKGAINAAKEADDADALRREVAALQEQLAQVQRRNLATAVPASPPLKSSIKRKPPSEHNTKPPRREPRKRVMFVRGTKAEKKMPPPQKDKKHQTQQKKKLNPNMFWTKKGGKR